MEEITISEKHIKAVAACKLFNNIPYNFVGAFVFSNCKVIRVKKDEILPQTDDNGEKFVSVLCDGSCVIYSKKDHNTILRFVTYSDSVGVASAYTDTPFESETVAYLESAEIIIINKTALDVLFRSDYGKIAVENFFKVLSDKIAFLNYRLSHLEFKSCDQLVAFYLKCASRGRDVFELEMTICALSDLLDLGRASLYRGFTILEEAGVIARKRNTIRILDRETLNNYS